jgi:hypothetical protein
MMTTMYGRQHEFRAGEKNSVPYSSVSRMSRSSISLVLRYLRVESVSATVPTESAGSCKTSPPFSLMASWALASCSEYPL